MKLQDLNLKYTSQLAVIHNMVNQHDTVSSSTLQKLDSLVSSNASALETVYLLVLVEALSQAELLLERLQGVLAEQQLEVTAFAEQRRELSSKRLIMLPRV